MERRSGHVGKSHRNKDYYTRYLERLDYTPTTEKEEVLSLPDSDSFEKDYSVPSVQKRRTRSFRESAGEHFRRNWLSWVAGVIALILMIFLYNISGTVGRIEGIIDGIREDLNTHAEKIEGIEEKVQEQELRLQEQSIKMEYLETDLKERLP